MKKILLTALLSAGLFAGSGIAPVYVQDAPEKVFYVGGGINSAETYTRDSNPNFTEWEDGEYTNVGLTVIAGWRAMRFENTKVFIEGRIGQSYWMEDSESGVHQFPSGWKQLVCPVDTQRYNRHSGSNRYLKTSRMKAL